MAKKEKSQERKWTQNPTKTNHIKTKMDNTQHNYNCRLCTERDETLNHIINECHKLVWKKTKSRNGWEGKVIHWESCMVLKIGDPDKRYVKFSPENERY